MKCTIHYGCLGLALVIVLSVGCSDSGVREDRTVEFSGDGKDVGFQHGNEGIFVADEGSTEVRRIYKPSDEVLAVSSPLWAPNDKRLIFTSAKSRSKEAANLTLPTWDESPDGRQFAATPIRYECFLRRDPVEKPDGPPQKLFEASSGHVGYVAANLAVRWHPTGRSIYFLDQDNSGRHSINEFDLSTKKRRRILDKTGDAVLFDWMPAADGSSTSILVIRIANREKQLNDNGIWFHNTVNGTTSKIRHSDRLPLTGNAEIIEQLRAMSLAWRSKANQLAFVVADDSSTVEQNVHTVCLCDLKTNKVIERFTGAGAFRDLHWKTDKPQLGFIQTEPAPQVVVLDGEGTAKTVTGSDGVRRFAGWNHDGTRLAFVKPAEPTLDGSVLFEQVPDSRDDVFVVHNDAKAPKRVHSGMRITFPKWSPTENKLSLWGTYTPSHQSLAAKYAPFGLQPGDPAAILDMDTGEMTWMAVNGHEQVQVGHYYLLKKNYKEAWRWYEKSQATRPEPKPFEMSNGDSAFRRYRGHQNPLFFEYHCLTRLGRAKEAAEKLQQFRKTLRVEFGDEWIKEAVTANLGKGREPELRRELDEVIDVVDVVLQAAYIAEIYLSLNAAEDAAEFFTTEFRREQPAIERFVYGICAFEMFAINANVDDQLSLVLDQLLPLSDELIEVDPSQEWDTTDFTKMRKQAISWSVKFAQDYLVNGVTNPEFWQRLTKAQRDIITTKLRARDADQQ